MVIALFGIALVLVVVAGVYLAFNYGQNMFNASESISIQTQTTTGSEAAAMLNPNYHLNFCGGVFVMLAAVVIGGGLLFMLFKLFAKFR